jgi:MYXO-CTERM domain-containing protein
METDVEQWLAVGSSGRVDVVNPDDGEPDTVTARAVNRGAGVSYGVVGSEGWLVGSESGWVQLLDADGRDQGARRPVFAGSNNNPDPLNFLSYGEDGWLAGGTNGRVQLIDRDGQPFSSGTVNTQVAGTDITAAARGSSSWLVGSSQGDLIDVSEDSISNGNIVSTLGSGSPIVSIVYVGGIGADGSGRWVVMNASDAVKVSVSGATSAVTVAPDKDVATATVQGTTVVVGSTDGSVATYDATTDLSEFSWETVFPDGQGIRQLVQGQSGWLALGESGDMRLLDENASPTGSVETLPHGKTPTAARSLSGDGNAAWMVGLGDTSTVQKLDANLDPLYQNDSIFGSESIEAAAAGGGNIAVVGSGGSYRLLNPDGAPQGEIQSVDGVTQWNDVTWDGSQFVMAGTGGTVAELKTDGTIGRMASYLGEEDLVDIEYTGDFFGIFSENARYRRLRRNIDPFRAPVDVDMDTIEAAGFDGQSWAIVGSRNNKATYTIVAEDETVIEAPREVFDVDGSFFTVEWNGREWLMGGSGGNVVRVDAQGTLIEIDGTQQIRNVLYGLPVRDISFTGTEYLVGGDNGIIRRLQGSDSLPIRPGVVVNGFGQVSALQWSQARGFGGGPCLSSDVCLSGGECIGGGVQNGVCCESSCDDPCVACEESVTGEPTGNCANIPSGEEPPEDGEGDCPAMAESTCGTTGVCNGQGECAVYGDNVQCRGQTCEDGEITAPATCNSENMTCGDGMAMTTSCDPYAACADDTSCLTSCSDDDQCIDGYVCSNQACVDEDEAGNGNGNGNGGGNGGGCHSTSDDTPAGGFVLLLTALGALVWSRRSREGSPPEEAA